MVTFPGYQTFGRYEKVYLSLVGLTGLSDQMSVQMLETRFNLRPWRQTIMIFSHQTFERQSDQLLRLNPVFLQVKLYVYEVVLWVQSIRLLNDQQGKPALNINGQNLNYLRDFIYFFPIS